MAAYRFDDLARDARQNRYYSDMHVAAQAWEDAHIDEVRQLLDLYIPQRGDEDLRGFEWHVLNHSLEDGADFPVLKQDMRVRSVAFFPDGKQLVVSGDRGSDQVSIWDIPTLTKRLTINLPGAGYVKHVTVASDGMEIACAPVTRCMRVSQ